MIFWASLSSHRHADYSLTQGWDLKSDSMPRRLFSEVSPILPRNSLHAQHWSFPPITCSVCCKQENDFKWRTCERLSIRRDLSCSFTGSSDRSLVPLLGDTHFPLPHFLDFQPVPHPFVPERMKNRSAALMDNWTDPSSNLWAPLDNEKLKFC